MKKFYIFSLCALAGASTLMAGTRFQTRRNAPRKTAALTETSAPDRLMRPATMTEYLNEDGEWLDLGTTVYTYDARGNAIVQETDGEDGLFRVETTFNEFDKPVLVIGTIEEDGETVNDNKRTYVYDPVVHDFFTERLAYDWNGNDWTRNYMCETNTVTRNDDGNIVEIVKALPLSNEMVPAYKSVWNYNLTTGKADGFAYYQYDSWGAQPGWVLYNQTSYRNIEWEATDGQMTASSMQEFLQGANRVKSADVYYDDELDGHFIVEYSSDKPGDYLVKETFADPSVVGVTTVYEVLDANGSFRQTDSEYFDEETGEPTDEPTYILVQETLFDANGNIASETITETYEGMTELVAGARYDNSYDDDGNLTEVVVNNYDYESEEYYPEMRYTFGEYTDVAAGVENVAADAVAADGFTVYNLQGVPVLRSGSADQLRSLPAGLYIVNGRKQVIR
ncbi:MAG: hypothetical protein K2K36_06820 [Muribaculaceae bacterium]|nr:hypothetical protein [Muribaculaceae bacterium]